MPDTTSLDLPPRLQEILSLSAGGVGQLNAPTNQSLDSIGPQAPTAGPSYQAGGQVGPGGQPIRPPAGLAPDGQAGAIPANPQVIEAEIQNLLSNNPQVLQTIRQAVMEGLKTGDLTQQELNQMVQLAQMALQNPQMWPQARAFAIQQGLASEQDIPVEFDPGLVVAVLLAGRAATANVGGQDVLQGGTPAQAGQPLPSYEGGGPLPQESPSANGEVPITAHEGEYVIPANVVRALGTDHFDNMIKKVNERGKQA